MKFEKSVCRSLAAFMAAMMIVPALSFSAFAEFEDEIPEEIPGYNETDPDVPLLVEPSYDPEEPEEQYDPAESYPESTAEPEYPDPVYEEESQWDTDEQEESVTYEPESTEEYTEESYNYEEERQGQYYEYEEPVYGEVSENKSVTDIIESSAEVSVDTSELTATDWETLQKNLNNSTPATADAKDFSAIKNSKDDGSGVNDSWLYLAIGIPLIVLGAGLIAAVIIINIRAGRKKIPVTYSSKGGDLVDTLERPERKK